MAQKTVVTTCQFPLYTVKWMPQTNCLFIAGGGGQAKTGVLNAFVGLNLNDNKENFRSY